MRSSLDSVERQFEVRDLALARLEGEKERGGEVQVRHFSSPIIYFSIFEHLDMLVIFCTSGEMIIVVVAMVICFRRGCERG